HNLSCSGKNFPRLVGTPTRSRYCKGEISLGSSTKTLYIVCLFPQPRYTAHAMQQVTVKMVEENEGRENRESAITLAQAGTKNNDTRRSGRPFWLEPISLPDHLEAST